jgi:prepilin-type N-terminal cleavage/methylation domain-containing protein
MMIRRFFIKIRPAIPSQKGFTLVELIVTLVLVGIIGTFTTLFMYTGLNGYLRAKDTSEGALKAQIALDRISLELKDITVIGAITPKSNPDAAADSNIDYSTTTLPGNRRIIYDDSEKEISIDVDNVENVLLDEVGKFTMTATYKDLNYYAGGELEVEFIEVSFRVGEIERIFSARIFPRNMVDDPTS